MTWKEIKPPKIAGWLLNFTSKVDDSAGINGDLEEMYREINSDKGRIKAWLWYWGQVIISIFPFINTSIFGSMAMFKSYLKIAWRNIVRYKGYSILNIGGLAIGISVFIMIGLYVQYELGYDRHIKNADRIYKVVWKEQSVTPNPLAEALENEFPEVEAATRLTRKFTYLVRYQNKDFFGESWSWADEKLFDVLSIQLISGDKNTALKDPYSLVINESTAEKYFGNEDPVGKVLNVVRNDENNDFIVTGVMKDIPQNSYIKADIFASIVTILDTIMPQDKGWGSYWAHTFFLLHKEGDPDTLESKYPEWLESQYSVRAAELYRNVPLVDMHLRSSDLIFHFNPVSDIKYIYLFAAVAIIIIIIAGVNYINLSTAQAAKRVREVGMRKVAGAQRSQLIRQFLGESVLLTFLSLIAAILLVYLLLPLFNSLIDCEENIRLSDNINVLLVMVGIGFLVGIAAGSYPAFFISNFSLFGIFHGSSSKNYMRNTLVVFQFSISIFLIISTIVTSDQLSYIKNKDLGYTKNHIVIVKVSNPIDSERQNAVKDELLKYPGITGVAFSLAIPMQIDWNNGFLYRDEINSSIESVNSNYSNVDYDYVDLFGLEIVKGRNFKKEFDEGRNVYIINEYTANQIGWDDPIGKLYTGNRRRGEIVGVVRDFHNNNLRFPIGGVTLCLSSVQNYLMSVKINTDNTQNVISSIEKVWDNFFSGYPFDYEFIDERYDNMYRSEIRMGNTFNYFASLAIFICCLGLFGLASFTVEQSTKEIGIRKAIGASLSSIIKLLSWKFLKLVIIANIIVWPAAYYYMNMWLQEFVYRIGLGWESFLSASAVAVAVAFLTVISRTMKAALTNPTESLRYE
ncbi:ABC transporter permease [candidate division KSB1 bacterium]